MDKMNYRVLIADDHPLARKAVYSMLASDPAFTVVGEALDGEQAVQQCEALQPDLVLMDIRMSGMNGLEATRIIKHRYPHIRVVMLTVSDDVADLFTALQFGAQGYLLKNMDPDEWLQYLHALLDENSEVARSMADSMFQRFRMARQAAEAASRPADTITSILTPRELEIVAWVAAGDNNRQIAEKLAISENTVKNHMKNILDKLHLDNRVQLTAFAVRYGLTRRY